MARSERGSARGGRDDDRGRGRAREPEPRGRAREPEEERGKGSTRRAAPADDDDDFGYRGRTTEDVGRRAKQSSGRYDSFVDEEVVWYSPREGENCIRIIPWLSGKHPKWDELNEKWGNHWGIDLITHMGVGADKGTYLCLDKMLGEPCPICDIWRGEDVEALKPKDRVLCWLIDRDDEKSGPKLWAMPMANSKDISAESMVKGSGELLLIDDPEEGYDVYFTREGTKRNTKYKQFDVARDPSPLHENEEKQRKWLTYVKDNCLPEILKYYDVEHLDKVLSGQISKSEDDDDEGAERGRRGGRGGGRDDDRGGRSSARPSRRGREEAPVEDDVRGSTRRRPSRDPDDVPEEEFTRPARGRGRERDADPEEQPPEEPEERGTRRSARAPSRPPREEPPPRTRRGRADPEVDPEDDDDIPFDKGKDKDDPPTRGGRNERFRGSARDKDPPEEPEPDGSAEDDTETAKGRLSRVGRRGRG